MKSGGAQLIGFRHHLVEGLDPVGHLGKRVAQLVAWTGWLRRRLNRCFATAARLAGSTAPPGRMVGPESVSISFSR